MKRDLRNTIFISYRRKDTGSSSGRLHDYLEKEFGASMVFKDIHDIGIGADFRKVIGQRLLNSEVVIVMIGDRYTSLKDDQGNIRILNDDDYVNIEASTALAFRDKKMIIPVLVNGARMPSQSELPSGMQELVYLNAITLSHENWKSDVNKLIVAIKQRLFPQKQKTPSTQYSTAQTSQTVKPAKKSNTGLYIGGGIGAFILLIVLLAWIGNNMDPEYDPDAITPSSTTILDYDESIQFSGIVANTNNLNLRNKPGTEGSDVVMVLGKNDPVEVLGSKYVDSKDWYYVDNQGVRGWVSSSYVKRASSRVKTTPPKKPQQQELKPLDQLMDERYATYPSLIMGTWKLNVMGFDGNSWTTTQFLTELSGGMNMGNCDMYYSMNGSINEVSTYVNGVLFEQPQRHTYSLYEDQFSMSNGMNGTITELNRNNLSISVNNYQTFGATYSMVFHFVRYR